MCFPIDRHCVHCKAHGSTKLGDEAHWLFDCPVAAVERGAILARVWTFFLEYPLKWEEEEDNITWDSDDFPVKYSVGFLLGSPIPDGLETTNCSPEVWMQ
jgi:hypothetical protein